MGKYGYYIQGQNKIAFRRCVECKRWRKPKKFPSKIVKGKTYLARRCLDCEGPYRKRYLKDLYKIPQVMKRAKDKSKLSYIYGKGYRDKMYGFELIMDLHGCDKEYFTRDALQIYLEEVCKITNMTPEDIYFWDDTNVPPEKRQTDPKTKGTSVVLFILQSSMVIHALDLLGAAYINIFTCKPFDPEKVYDYTIKFFSCQRGKCKKRFIERF